MAGGAPPAAQPTTATETGPTTETIPEIVAALVFLATAAVWVSTCDGATADTAACGDELLLHKHAMVARFAAHGVGPEAIEFRGHTSGDEYLREFADSTAGINIQSVPANFATDWQQKYRDVKGNFDGMAFVRTRTDSDDHGEFPEFYNPRTQEASNSSAAGMLRAGVTFWW